MTTATIPSPCLCLVTDRSQTGGRPLETVVKQAVDGGVGMVQLRERDLPGGQLLDVARRLRRITEGRSLLFINERIDIALLCGADGVQLGEGGISLPDARELAGDRLLLSRSVHSVQGAVDAINSGAELLVVGTIFETGSHPSGTISGPGLIKEIANVVDAPILGIGGINKDNVGQVIDADGTGAAVITAISAHDDPLGATRELATAMNTAWAGSGAIIR
ncbi:MAG: thiamine phosphate synthase [SAR202 cluster bacterium]|nr:thiamine phosphate synthase [SAR202 cluster bacterium]MDP6302436.1 thiamine phosphate synthase [SAR202 cluster bacterium]MDP7103541.1 thiamine phosphate synthase [SAR202 cluster bacterium]MDP7223927.1 thiamine phosphate synthase [SAR202 cluster bacterium]MDP7413217.1 thiamine phosphate synthase [SAR202 cluster bacterium]